MVLCSIHILIFNVNIPFIPELDLSMCVFPEVRNGISFNQINAFFFLSRNSSAQNATYYYQISTEITRGENTIVLSDV